MDQKTMTLKCFRCQKQFLLLEMVMDASGKGMSCRACAGLPPKGEKAKPAAASRARQMFSKPSSPKNSNGKYACMNCRFRFSSSKPIDQIICPYCGSRRISTPSQNSADALLRDASGREYDF
jgi:DNA-directed RNA polymerase subunit RPC12/RpoP